MLFTYYTVKQSAKHEIIIQNSRFIAHIERVKTEEDAVRIIEAINKEHWKANHNCFAYCIGEQHNIQKASDDGEPSGTAGVPILEVLKKKDLHDTLVVVTRYFGGIKLGAGGLIRAYSKATSEGLRASGIVLRRLMQVVRTKIDYSLLGSVENHLRQSSYIIKHMDYTEKVDIFVYVPETERDLFKEWMTDLTNGTAQIKSLEQEYLEEELSDSD